MSAKEELYKSKIRENLGNVLSAGLVPELGKHKKGKVRDVYFASDKIIMIASDRVSCFDHVLSRRIPYKGIVLNLFNKWALESTKDIIQNAAIESPDPSVVIQKKLEVIPFEFVVRGYVWGSMAQAYEKGEREFCGHVLSDDLLRYQKLEGPLFTPATKAEEGHDINISFEQLAEVVGRELATKLRDAAISLFKRASELAEKRGMIFIDTKYEFGEDENGDIYLIDEANTPDSSRYCKIDEYEKFEKIKERMASGSYKNVSELIEEEKDLKIKELSKQFVRDVLVESGYGGYGGDEEVPELTDENVVETSWRYISLYEELTGEEFKFEDYKNVKQGLINNLVSKRVVKGGCVIILAGSDSDKEHIKKISDELDNLGIPWVARICSAHKQASKCEELIDYYNQSIEPLLIVAVAGGTDALSGVASYHSVWPVISCPPDKNEYLSCIANPPGSSNAIILRPANVARFAAQCFGYANIDYRDSLLENNKHKIDSLDKADEQFLNKEF